MKDRIDEHDMTKKMLNIIREGMAQSSDDTIDVDKQTFKTDEDSFGSQVTEGFKFNIYKVYPQTNNVVLSGVFTEDNLEFQLTLSESDGVFINSTNLKLTNNMVDTLHHLQGYYANWSKEWRIKLRKEYNINNQ